jgi:enoyl-CoA hydratase
MESVRYEKRAGIAKVTLCRESSHNAISREMNDRLWEIWRDFESDESTRVAILTGSGDRAFCAGADLKDYIPTFFADSARAVRRNAARGLGGITRGLHRIYKPIIAAVNGYALAGGFELALACDVRIASRNAVFGSFEIRRGFHHGDGGIVRLLASVGLARTMDIVLTGREIPAEEALSLGLVSRIVPAEALLPTAEALAEQMAALSPSAVRSAKETIMEVVGRRLDDALLIEALFGYSSGDVADVRERLGKFFAREGNG